MYERPSLLCAYFQQISDFFFQTAVSVNFGMQQIGEFVPPSSDMGHVY